MFVLLVLSLLQQEDRLFSPGRIHSQQVKLVGSARVRPVVASSVPLRSVRQRLGRLDAHLAQTSNLPEKMQAHLLQGTMKDCRKRRTMSSSVVMVAIWQSN